MLRLISSLAILSVAVAQQQASIAFYNGAVCAQNGGSNSNATATVTLLKSK